jgi:hypothetical protein
MRETYCPAMLLVYTRRRERVSVSRVNDFFVPFKLDQTRQENTSFITPTTPAKEGNLLKCTPQAPAKEGNPLKCTTQAPAKEGNLLKCTQDFIFFASVLKIWYRPPPYISIRLLSSSNFTIDIPREATLGFLCPQRTIIKRQWSRKPYTSKYM